MTRKFTLSPAKATAYLNCRQIYFNNYISKINRYYYKQNIGDTFGGSIHRALDKFHKAEEQSLETLTENLKSAWSSGGYKNKSEEDYHFTKANEILHNYYKSNIGANVIATEKTLKKDMGPYNLIGRIDRIDEISHNDIRLVDYKSGRLDVTYKELKSNLAMRIYYLLAKKAFPENKIYTGIYCLSTGKQEYVSFTEDEEKNTIETLNKITENMMSMDENTSIIPKFNINLCPRCIYYKICKKKFNNPNL